MIKNLVFDIDGTIANFYKVNNWLDDLKHEKVRPYEVAPPIYNMQELNNILLELKANGYKITVVSWLAKDSTQEYKNKVRKAKREWLKKYDFPYDEIHLVQHGTPKHYVSQGILIDDNEEVRNRWRGMTINANKNIIKILQGLL